VLQDTSINLEKIFNMGIKHNIWRTHKTSEGGEPLEFVIKSAMASFFFATRVFWVHSYVAQLVRQEHHFNFNDIVPGYFTTV